MLPLRFQAQTECASGQTEPQDALALLNLLRFTSMRCRAKPRTSLFEACALLHADRHAKKEAYAEALARCFSEALGQPARFLAPGTEETTFDENWLLQLALAEARWDNTSADFLLRSRVSHEHQRLVRFLVSHLFEIATVA